MLAGNAKASERNRRNISERACAEPLRSAWREERVVGARGRGNDVAKSVEDIRAKSESKRSCTKCVGDVSNCKRRPNNPQSGKHTWRDGVHRGRKQRGECGGLNAHHAGVRRGELAESDAIHKVRRGSTKRGTTLRVPHKGNVPRGTMGTRPGCDVADGRMKSPSQVGIRVVAVIDHGHLGKVKA